MVSPARRTRGTQQPGAGADAGTPLLAAPYPVLAVSAAGVVQQANAAAAALFPPAAPGTPLASAAPGWLVTGHRRFTAAGPPGGSSAAVEGAVGERFFEAHATRPAAGQVVWWLIDATDRRLAEEALRIERERTAFLTEASDLLLSSLNLDRCMDVTAQLAARHLADAAIVVAPVSGRRTPVTLCVRGGSPARRTPVVREDDAPGLGEALQGFPPVPSRWTEPALAPQWMVPEGFGEVGSMMITPLPGQGVPAGALVLLRHSEEPFPENEEGFARIFAARAGTAMSAARLYAEQASITETLLRELLPPKLEHVDGVEFAAGYRAAGEGERIGGDFYDLHPAAGAGQETLVVLGDVCGKGLEAAVLTGKIRNTLHALLPMSGDHRGMLRLLNGALVDSHHTRFATLVLASAAREGEGVRLRLTSAGHPPPLIVRADGRVEEADTGGSLVGVLPEIDARTARVHLARGETCVLFSDGITEARGGPLGDTMFGERRLRAALSECAGLPAEAVVERLQMLTSHWVGNRHHDDMAVVAITAPRTFLPAPPGARKDSGSQETEGSYS